MRRSYYSKSISEFLLDASETILGHLTRNHGHDLDPLQRNAWLGQILVLQRELKYFEGGWIALEFAIPRMGKRADAIVVSGGIVFVIEFKVGAKVFDSAARDQVLDYALDLKNFHEGSHEKLIVPILIATDAEWIDPALVWSPDGVATPLLSNDSSLSRILDFALANGPIQSDFDPGEWEESRYKPTPTIIEAAQALYGGHQVEEITRSDSGAKNLGETTEEIWRIVDRSKREGHKAICFVTGVPGAGKTLAGLNLVSKRTKSHKDENAVFLSGNGPLVDVLREALARDDSTREHGYMHVSIADARRKVKSFIQNIHHFRDDNYGKVSAPIEHVVVFDEAQRAWDREQAVKFMMRNRGEVGFDASEPEFLISVMDRHEDWCTIICLVGGGQEINAGEAGLTEWILALQRKFRDWKVYISAQIDHPNYSWGGDLVSTLAGIDHKTINGLHLATCVRSFRAEKLSDFVDAIIGGNAEVARGIHAEICEVYPIRLTRRIGTAKDWLNARARGSERVGLVASSGASRLKPEGLNVHEKIVAANWFLNSKTDVRSSFYLEDPATEFDIQGLELDWIGVCWDADLRVVNGRWSHYKFRGTKWQNVNSEVQRTYLRNAYRVLLTRARQGMIIYVPLGDQDDPTRRPEFYDNIAAFLTACGIQALNE